MTESEGVAPLHINLFKKLKMTPEIRSQQSSPTNAILAHSHYTIVVISHTSSQINIKQQQAALIIGSVFIITQSARFSKVLTNRFHVQLHMQCMFNITTGWRYINYYDIAYFKRKADTIHSHTGTPYSVFPTLLEAHCTHLMNFIPCRITCYR